MMENSLLYYKIMKLPDNLKKEAEDFIEFLNMKSKRPTTDKKPKFGSAKGTFLIKEDFDEPLEDFKEYME